MTKQINKLLSVALSLAIALSFTACGNKTGNAAAAAETTEQKFDKFTQEEFVKAMEDSTLFRKFTIDDPAKYNIKTDKVTLGDVTPEANEKYYKQLKAELEKLETFNKTELSKKQQLTYDVMKAGLEEQIKGFDYQYHTSSFSPMQGVHDSIIVNFVEYKFDNKKDIEDYIILLKDVDRYLKEIIEFEKVSIEKGFGLKDIGIDATITACKTFLEPKENSLVAVFNEKIATVDGLTEKEKTDFIAENEKAVKEHVIPAYENVITELGAMKGKAKNQGGMINDENGKEAYAHLIKTKTGSSKTPEEITKMLEQQLMDCFMVAAMIQQADPDIFDKMQNAQIKAETPEKMIALLEDYIKTDYPPMADVNVVAQPIMKSVQNPNNAGYYMSSPIDNYKDNVIKYNQELSIANPIDFFSTIAHEGVPGHMYQHTYFYATNPDPIRSLFNWTGYAEAWTRRVEEDVAGLSGIDEEGNTNISQMITINSQISEALICRADIGVNYEGWDKAKVKEFLTQYGMGSDETVAEIYRIVTCDPVAFMPYNIGLLEIKELEEYAQKALGDKYKIIDFRKAYLEVGNAPFDIVKAAIDEYIAKVGGEAAKAQ